MAKSRGTPVVANIEPEVARALEVFKELTRTSEGRQRFATAEIKRDVFDAKKRRLPKSLHHLRTADYTAIPEPVRALLERLSVSELALLSDLDATYVEAGLYAEVPSPGFLMIH